MMRFVLAVVVAALALSASAEDKKDAKKGEVLKTITNATYAFDKDKKTLTVTATGQVPTGGWSGAALTPRLTTKAPKDGIYEYDLTAVRPTGIVTEALAKVKASHTWDNPPADIKGVTVYGEGAGAKTITFDK